MTNTPDVGLGMHILLQILAHTCQIGILPRLLFSEIKGWPAGKWQKPDKEFFVNKSFLPGTGDKE